MSGESFCVRGLQSIRVGAGRPGGLGAKDPRSRSPGQCVHGVIVLWASADPISIVMLATVQRQGCSVGEVPGLAGMHAAACGGSSCPRHGGLASERGQRKG